jgi:hypothetical protein
MSDFEMHEYPMMTHTSRVDAVINASEGPYSITHEVANRFFASHVNGDGFTAEVLVYCCGFALFDNIFGRANVNVSYQDTRCPLLCEGYGTSLTNTTA